MLSTCITLLSRQTSLQEILSNQLSQKYSTWINSTADKSRKNVNTPFETNINQKRQSQTSLTLLPLFCVLSLSLARLLRRAVFSCSRTFTRMLFACNCRSISKSTFPVPWKCAMNNVLTYPVWEQCSQWSYLRNQNPVMSHALFFCQ